MTKVSEVTPRSGRGQRSDRPSPALEDNQLATARLKPGEIPRHRAVLDGSQLRINLRHVTVEVEIAPVPFGAENPFKQPIERRLARRVKRGLEKRPWAWQPTSRVRWQRALAFW